MKNFSEIHPKIRNRFLSIRGPLMSKSFLGFMAEAENTQYMTREFDELLAQGPVCIINVNGRLFRLDIPANVDLSKIPQSTYVKL